MTTKSRVKSRESRAVRLGSVPVSRPSSLDPQPIAAFTLIEVLVVMTLLSLIVLVLMAVFSSTQQAFRMAATQSKVLEAGRAAIDLLSSDLKLMSPSMDSSNFNNSAVNFGAWVPAGYIPLVQPLVASGPAQSRTNVQEQIFILSRQNQTWTGVGYVIANSSQGDFDTLYRYSASANVQATNDPAERLFGAFILAANNPQSAMSPLMDGVVSLTVRAYDINGGLMTGNVVFSGGQATTNQNVVYLPSLYGTGFYMFSNALPASVEIEIGALEDRVLQRAASLPNIPPSYPQTTYLQGQAGAVHVFRQRISIPNVDPSAFQ